MRLLSREFDGSNTVAQLEASRWRETLVIVVGPLGSAISSFREDRAATGRSFHEGQVWM